ncbi:MAG: transcriptional repressor LexA [Blastocatellia bacterium]|nr:transcriptional repressor LexA [Blastocatellia bacterium]
MTITPRQRELFDYLCRFITTNGHAPTIAEMQGHLDLSSPASVHHLLTALEGAGLIHRIPNAGRGIEIVKPDAEPDETEIPLLGVIAAGYPIEAILNQETVPVPRNLVGRGRTFALRVKGQSMIGEHICEGDYIVVESRQTAENGQTVVALVDGTEATVKRFFKERGQIRLEPANPEFRPIVVPADRVHIQGIVIGLIRKYQR